MATTATQQVGSHITLVQFGGAKVPIGFLASFRKHKHLICESGRGFVTRVTAKEGRMQMVCECAVPRATARLRQIGSKSFEAQGQEWLVDERRRLEANEASCREEGKKADQGTKCPYPFGTDQHLAWMEGHEAVRQALAIGTKDDAQKET